MQIFTKWKSDAGYHFHCSRDRIEGLFERGHLLSRKMLIRKLSKTLQIRDMVTTATSRKSFTVHAVSTGTIVGDLSDL